MPNASVQAGNRRHCGTNRIGAFVDVRGEEMEREKDIEITAPAGCRQHREKER